MGQSLYVATPIASTRFLGQWLSHIEAYVDGVVCIAHNNEEVADTLESHPVVDKVIYRTDPFHETIFRNELWSQAVSMHADWVLLLDVDEMMDLRFVRDVKELMEDEQACGYTFMWFNYWGDDRHVRIDGGWDPRWKRRIKLLRAYDILPHKNGAVQYGPANFIPQNGQKIVDNDIYKILHYGHIDQEMWNQKRETWKIAPKSLRKWWDGIGTEEDLKDVKLVDYNENFTAKEFIDKHIKKK